MWKGKNFEVTDEKSDRPGGLMIGSRGGRNEKQKGLGGGERSQCPGRQRTDFGRQAPNVEKPQCLTPPEGTTTTSQGRDEKYTKQRRLREGGNWTRITFYWKGLRKGRGSKKALCLLKRGWIPGGLSKKRTDYPLKPKNYGKKGKKEAVKRDHQKEGGR